jgi:tetratricopeptide (TPR) repeat protein
VRFWLGRCHWYRNEYAEAVGYYRRVLTAARQLGDEELAALPSGTIGRVLIAQGHAGRAMDFLEPSLGPLERGESWDEWIVNAGFTGVSLSMRGRAAEAVAVGERVLARARATQSLTSEAIALVLLGGIHVFSGAVAPGRERFGAGVAAAERAGDRVYEFVARGFVAWADGRLGRHDEAAAGMVRAREIMADLGRRLVFADWFDAFALESAARAGRFAEVIAAAGPAVAAFAAAGSTFAEGITRRAWGLSLAGRGEGAVEEAVAQLRESERLLDEGEVYVEAERTRAAIAEVEGAVPLYDDPRSGG